MKRIIHGLIAFILIVSASVAHPNPEELPSHERCPLLKREFCIIFF